MGKATYSASSAVVLTTHERYAYFSAVLGEGVDVYFSPQYDPPLETLLHNASISGGKLVVIDEAYFLSEEDMVTGLERFVDTSARAGGIDLVVVCADRGVGDRLLAHLVTYCQVHNVIYGKNGAEISIELASVLRHPRKRSELADIVACLGWERRDRPAKDLPPKPQDGKSDRQLLIVDASKRIERRELVVNANQQNVLCIQVEIVTKEII